MTMFDTEYADSICFIPVTSDGTKRPLLSSWKQFQKRLPMTMELTEWRQAGYSNAIVAGSISEYLEVIDVDDVATIPELLAMIEQYLPSLRHSLPMCSTPSGGLHIYIRCRDVEGNQKLAQRNDGKTRIETRGEGGYVVAPPTAGYEWIQGDLDDIPELDTTTREALLDLCRSFNELVQEDFTPGANVPTGGDHVSAAWERETTWESLLRDWTILGTDSNGRTLLRRPGKDIGISATLNNDGTDRLYVFTTSLKIPANRYYTKFQYLTYSKYNGDFKRSAGVLYSQGYRSATKPTAADPLFLYDAHIATDLCNARRLVAQHGDDLKYTRELGWLVYGGTHWEANEFEAINCAKRTASNIRSEYTNSDNNELVKTLSAWSKKSEQCAGIENMLKLAQSEPGMLANLSDFDLHPWELNVGNGIVDLRDGSLRDHDRASMHLKHIPIDYNPKARCPLWEQTVLLTMGGDREMARHMQKLFGYSLTGETHEDIIMFMYGPLAQNGKSTLSQPFLKVIGSYGTSIDKATIMANAQHSSARTDLARLVGMRFVVTSELNEGDRLDEALVKNMTGDEMTALT